MLDNISEPEDKKEESENNKNINNNDNKNEDEMIKLLKKLDNQIKENKTKSILNLPRYNIDLDFDLDVDITSEKKTNINNKQNNDIIIGESNKEKNDKNSEINIEIDDISEKEEEKEKLKNINFNKNKDLKQENNYEEKDEERISLDNNDNDSNNVNNNKENENSSKKDSIDENNNLLNSSKKEEINNNNINNDNNEDKDIAQENNNNNNNKDMNDIKNNMETIESKYEDCNSMGIENIPKNLNPESNFNEKNEENNNKNNLEATEEVIIEDENKNKEIKDNSNKQENSDKNNASSELEISEKAEIESKKSEKNNKKEKKNSVDIAKEEQKKLEIILDEIINLRNNKDELNNNEIEKYKVINVDFNHKEKTLDDLIPDISSKIENNETSEKIEKRKHNFMEHKYFEGSITENHLLYLYQDCKISHTELMEKIYKEQGLKNIPEISEENYDKEIFKKNNNILPNNLSKISSLQTLQNFLFKYRLDTDKKISTNCFTYFKYWRFVENDGNSFYRTIMFSVIENFILTNQIIRMNHLISEITCDRFVAIYKENNINYDIPFYILGVILYLLENNKTEEAYSIFIKSYSLKDGFFDKMLIIYLRNITYDYVNELLELCKDEEIIKKYEILNINTDINKELIKTMNIEPEFFFTFLMPHFFDINLIIYWIDNDLCQPNDGIINFKDEDNPELPNISIAYFFSSFHKIYWKKRIQQNQSIEKIIANDIITMNKLTYELKSKAKCNICKKNDIFIFLVEKKIKICKTCLNDYIDEISNTRKESLIKNNYIGKEFYTRPILLKSDFYLNDFEFIEIKEDYNMINYLQLKLTISCSQCKNFFTKKNLNNLKCKCLLCDKCLTDMINTITQGKKILNIYEKNNLGKIKCIICNGNFDYNNTIEYLKDIKESDKDKAINRMMEYANTLCFICGDKVREKSNNSNNINNSNNNGNISNSDFIQDESSINNEEEKEKEKYSEIKKYKIIKLKREGEKNKGIDYIDTNHVICMDCFEKNKTNNILNTSSDEDEENSKNKYYINFKEGACFCCLCNKKHFLLDKIQKDGNCCKSSICSLI